LAGLPATASNPAEVSHADVLEIGKSKADDMRRLVEKIIALRVQEG
jgi:purine nucleoside phosphorylase